MASTLEEKSHHQQTGYTDYNKIAALIWGGIYNSGRYCFECPGEKVSAHRENKSRSCFENSECFALNPTTPPPQKKKTLDKINLRQMIQAWREEEETREIKMRKQSLTVKTERQGNWIWSPSWWAAVFSVHYLHCWALMGFMSTCNKYLLRIRSQPSDRARDPTWENTAVN